MAGLLLLAPAATAARNVRALATRAGRAYRLHKAPMPAPAGLAVLALASAPRTLAPAPHGRLVLALARGTAAQQRRLLASRRNALAGALWQRAALAGTLHAAARRW